MRQITFLYPELFWLFCLLPIAFYIWYRSRNNQRPTLTLSAIEGFSKKKSLLVRLKPLSIALKLLAISALIVALARPQTVDVSNKVHSTHGIDIVMAMDISGSMLAKDLKPNRIDALKTVAADFIKNRTNDRIGLVIYAAEAYTKTPVTSDKPLLLNALKDVVYNDDLKDGTAIGVGLATAVNRLKDSPAKSKVIILLTDGVNNAGFVDPRMATDIAKEFKIKVYTIGIGTNGMAESPYAYSPSGELLFRMMPVEIDEALLKEIAQKTDGKYFRATDTKSLKKIYDEINSMEKTKVDEQKFVSRNEKFHLFALLGFILLCLEFILQKTLFKGFI